MYLEAVFRFYVLLNHFVGHFFFGLVRFGSFSNTIYRNLALALSKLHINVDITVGFFVGQKNYRLTYFRTRITDADGKRVPIYASTCEELYKKEQDARQQVQDILFRKQNPTVEDYCERWLLMRSATVTQDTLRNYRREMYKYIVEPLGNLYLSDVTADDIKLALVPVSKRAKHTFDTVNMLIKSVFYSAERSEVIDYNPAAKISAKGGVPGKPMDALTDEQVKKLVDAVKGLPPYVFVMLGLYAGLRREESLALQWDCVFLDTPTPYISVRRAWRGSHRKEPEISTVLKTPASRRDIPIPKCLVECLREAKRSSKSAFVISNRKGGPLSEGEFVGVWYHVKNHTAGEKISYKYVNGEHIRYTTCPVLGSHRKGSPNHVYSLDFHVTPHQLRHTYITNLLYMGVDPKTVQYLAGHKNSKTTMDIYAKIKYNKPQELLPVVNAALRPVAMS